MSVALSAGVLSADEMRLLLKFKITLRYGTQSAAAKAWDVSDQFVSAVLNGRKSPNHKMLNEIGLEQVVAYKRQQTGDAK